MNRDFPYIGLVSRCIVRESVSESHRAIERSLYPVITIKLTVLDCIAPLRESTVGLVGRER